MKIEFEKPLNNRPIVTDNSGKQLKENSKGETLKVNTQ